MFGMLEQFKFVDAALAAGVKRFFPAEYGLDEIPDWLEEIRPVFRIKHEVHEYLKSKENDGLSWTGIVCNSLFEFAVLHGLAQVDLSTRVVELVDGGTTAWASTTLDTVGLAIVRSIEHPAQTKNRELLIQDFMTSQKDIFESVQNRVGPWEVKEVDSDTWRGQALMGIRGRGIDVRAKDNMPMTC